MDHTKWNVSKEHRWWVAWEPMTDPDAGGINEGEGFARWREAYSYARRRAELDWESRADALSKRFQDLEYS